jgi:large subunit ribosomal protein L23
MSTERLLNVLRAPHVSEKAARIQESANQYVFEVAPTATKADVKAAVEKLFNVAVERVTVVNVKGKNKAFRGRQGQRADARKAYVSLRQGQNIDLGAKA